MCTVSSISSLLLLLGQDSVFIDTNFVNESHLFTQGKTIATTYTTTAREPSIYVTEFPNETLFRNMLEDISFFNQFGYFSVLFQYLFVDRVQ